MVIDITPRNRTASASVIPAPCHSRESGNPRGGNDYSAISQCDVYMDEESTSPLLQITPNKQLDKIADFLLDFSKLLIASVMISFFVPESTGGKLDLPTFIAGALLALASFVFGVILTHAKDI